MEYKLVKVEKQGGVATVTINRPEAFNALNPETREELREAFQDFAKDEAVRAVILTGAGKAFSAGGDIKEMEAKASKELTRSIPEIRESIKTSRQIIDVIQDLEKPVIAAVNGIAAGLGATIALACDIVIMADTAKIGDTHIKIGVVPGDGGMVFWPLLIGPNRAKQYLMTGDYLDGKEAERIGLVNQVVPAAELMSTSKALAQRLAEGPTIGIGWTKLVINKMVKQWYYTAFEMGFALEMHTFNTQDHREAARAFVGKRQPKFKGE